MKLSGNIYFFKNTRKKSSLSSNLKVSTNTTKRHRTKYEEAFDRMKIIDVCLHPPPPLTFPVRLDLTYE